MSLHVGIQSSSVPWSAIGSVLESMPRSVLVNILGGVIGSVLESVLRAPCECLESLLGSKQ
jgi:hypothetical protein